MDDLSLFFPVISNLLRGHSSRIPIVSVMAPIGRKEKKAETERLRAEKIVLYPEDIGLKPADARHDLLAAETIDDLVKASGGLYKPPACFL